MKSAQRLMILLGILLPVPLFAATGLTIPLPASVERLAAELVPFADAADIGGAQPAAIGSRGKIVEAKGEVRQKSAVRTAERVKAALVRKAARHASSKPQSVRVKKVRNVPPASPGAAHRRYPQLQPKPLKKPKYKAPMPLKPAKVSKPTRSAPAKKIR